MSSYKLKVIAVLCMTLDHIALYLDVFPEFRYIGRIAAPCFLFCSAWGWHYTNNPKKYLLRLYISGVIMSVLQCIQNDDSNFFRILFYMGLIICIIKAFKNKLITKKQVIFFVLFQGIVIGIYYLLAIWFSNNFTLYCLPAILGIPISLEGGLIFAILGVLIYLTKNSKIKLSVVYILSCITIIMLRSTFLNELIFYTLQPLFKFNFLYFIYRFADEMGGLSWGLVLIGQPHFWKITRFSCWQPFHSSYYTMVQKANPVKLVFMCIILHIL